MTGSQETFIETSFKSGKTLSISSKGTITLPDRVPTGQESEEALFIKCDDGWHVIPRVPDAQKLYIEATTHCNFACTTCIRNSWQDDLSHMEWSVFERILDSIPHLPQLERVHFGGFGEPFSHPRFLEMLALVKGQGVKVEAITNGSLLSEEVINKLIDMQMDNIFISLDGPDEEEYCNIRQGADFTGVLDNIRLLNEVKERRGVRCPELGIEFVATKDNYRKLPQMASLASELRARRLIVTNVLPYNEEMKDQILYDMDDTDVPFGDNSPLLLMQAHLPYMKLRTERYCKFVEDKAMAVKHKGLISPCYAFMHWYNCYIYDRKKEIYPFYMGDVTKKLLSEIWTEPTYMNFRRAVKDFRFPSCTDCKFLDGCSYTETNEGDCWGNSPSCADCLWARQIIACP